MVTVDVRESWTLSELMEKVVEIETNLRRIKQASTTSFALQKSRGNGGSGETMDWEPTATHSARPESAGGRRAEWASKGEQERRRQNRLCLRCGKGGHYIATCRLLPALPPNTQTYAAGAPAEAEEETESEN